MNNLEFINLHQQIDLIDRKNEMLFILGGAVVITSLIAYGYYLQTQRLTAHNYIMAGRVNNMYNEKEAALESKEIAELNALHYKNEFEKIKQQVNAKPQIK